MRVRVAFFTLMLSASMAVAGPVDDAIVQQLQDQGYTAVDVRKTLLGRIRIIAASKTRVREIILNPNSGEILRDYSSRRNRLVEPLLRGIENNQGKTRSTGTDRPEDRGHAEEKTNKVANSNTSVETSTDATPSKQEAKTEASKTAVSAAKESASDTTSGAAAPSE